MLAAALDSEAFSDVRDEIDYAYAVKAHKEKKRAARAKTKGIKALNACIAQAQVNKQPPRHLCHPAARFRTPALYRRDGQILSPLTSTKHY
jgi:hypothetical protein